MSVRHRLGGIVVARFGVPKELVAGALRAQRSGDSRLGEILVRTGAITEDQLLEAIGLQFRMPVARRLETAPIREEVLALVPFRIASRRRVLPLSVAADPEGSILLLAMADPADRRTIFTISEFTGMRVSPAVTSMREIHQGLLVHYLHVAPDRAAMASRLQDESHLGAPIPLDPHSMQSTAA